MENHQLSFCNVNILNDNVAEVIIDNNISVSLEMVEEFDELLCSIFNGDFGVLVNKINTYSYTLEAKLVMGLIARMKAIATVNYSSQDTKSTQDIKNIRSKDSLNLKTFSAYEMGRQNAYNWLKLELSNNGIRIN